MHDKIRLIVQDSPALNISTLATALNWGGNSYPSYEGRLDVAAAPAAPAAPSTPASPSPAAGGGGNGTPPTPNTPSPGDGQLPGGSPTPNAPNAPNEENLRALRQNYETLKPWEKFAQTAKDPKVAERAFTTFTGMQTEAAGLAQRLGYTQESFAEAFGDDPAGILAHLRNEYAGRNPQYAEQQRLMKFAEDAAKRANKPIMDQMNKTATDAAISLLNNETDRLFADEKVGFGAGAPPEVKEAVDYLMEQFLTDQDYVDLKLHKKTAGVSRAFEQAKNQIIKLAQAYNAHTAKRGVGNNPPPNNQLRRNLNAPNNGGGDKPLTLDDIINSPETHLPGLKANVY